MIFLLLGEYTTIRPYSYNVGVILFLCKLFLHSCCFDTESAQYVVNTD